MSNEVKTKEKVDMDPKYIITLTVTLFVTCVIVAGLLGLVNQVTAPNIAAINKEKTETAMKAVVADPEGSTFSDALEITEEMNAAASGAGGTVTEAYEVQAGGAAAGYAIKVVASGSQGSGRIFYVLLIVVGRHILHGDCRAAHDGIVAIAVVGGILFGQDALLLLFQIGGLMDLPFVGKIRILPGRISRSSYRKGCPDHQDTRQKPDP